MDWIAFCEDACVWRVVSLRGHPLDGKRVVTEQSPRFGLGPRDKALKNAMQCTYAMHEGRCTAFKVEMASVCPPNQTL